MASKIIRRIKNLCKIRWKEVIMEELYSIMRDFLEVEHNQKSFVSLLTAAESAYTSENQIKAKLVANSAKVYLKDLQVELKKAINRMDSYIAENAKK